ncbi:MAG: NAD(P)/FAD-dependent oxidoreductase, partial [Aquificaceae bacterium]|nr:NAD(P)/FAD-dependent oxidoreductase [Aquificaceae bacterium]
MERFDVLVVGGGPAGATCAYELSGGGLRVLLVDIKRRIGTPVQCAEFVPVQLAHQFKAFFPQEAVVQRVKNMLHFTPWGQTVSMWSEGYMLDREVFDYHIAELSRQRGAKVLLRTRFLGFEGDIVWLERLDRRETFPVKVDLVVGADGPRSRVARLTGKGTENFLTTAQVTLPLVERLEDLLVYFREYIPGGYGWLFPKGQVANVGVGVDPYFSVNVVESLKRLVGELVAEGLVENKVLK